MKKHFILLGMLTIGLAYSQTGKIGVNTATPKATLDISPSNANAVVEQQPMKVCLVQG